MNGSIMDQSEYPGGLEPRTVCQKAIYQDSQMAHLQESLTNFQTHEVNHGQKRHQLRHKLAATDIQSSQVTSALSSTSRPCSQPSTHSLSPARRSQNRWSVQGSNLLVLVRLSRESRYRRSYTLR